jgi:holliday junction DNA helicase RuvA
MIALLRGTLVERSAAGWVVVDVGGVGYRALVAPSTQAELGRPGSEVVLHTHLHVREDAMTLYGFADGDERAVFEVLLAAHGVGPALALAILTVHGPAALRRALADDDVGALCLVPGVGRKTAARLLLELKARFDLPEVGGDVVAGADVAAPSVRSEVRAALVALGYGPDEVREALRALPEEGDVTLLVKQALTRMATVA